MNFDGWREVKLGDVVDINKNSYTLEDNWDFINYLDTGNITENRINSIQFLHRDRDKIPSRAKRKVFKNDIIYSTVRPNQKHYGILKEPVNNMLVSTGFSVITGKPFMVDNRFLYYYLSQQHIVDLLHTIGEQSTSAYPSIKSSDIESLNVLIPPIDKQQSIAATLSCLDDKIELNNQINKAFEGMAQAIFKSWFVDFEPFQDGEFEDSELGMIPKGWSVGTISSFTTYMKNGGTPSRKKEKYWNSSDVPWIKTGEIKNALIIGNEEYISYEGLQNSSAKLLPFNSVLVAMYGATAGKVGLLRFEASTNQACCAMLCNSANQSIYLYLYFLHNQPYIESLAVGAAQQNLSKDTISKLNIVVPPEDFIESVLFNEIFAHIEYNLRENQQLKNLRDSLLPKLMSGEVRVPIEEVQ